MFRSALVSIMMALVAALLAVGAAAAAAPSAVGIRVIFTEPADGATCTHDEHNSIVAIMYDGIADLLEQQQQQEEEQEEDSHRSLQSWQFNRKRATQRVTDYTLNDNDDSQSSTTDPSFCKKACAGFAKGTCYV
jgi:flagellar motility protein MotE (MotC chaperone)